MTRPYVKHGRTHTAEYKRETKLKSEARHPELRERRFERLRRLNSIRTPRQAMKAHLRHFYGLEIEAYDEMVRAQEGRCAICHRETPLLQVDHDHATGQVRGLLCGSCNRALGWVGDSIERLRHIIAYLIEGSRGCL